MADFPNLTIKLSGQLEGAAFGKVLAKATNFAYVGGPNTSVKAGETDGKVNGEIWIPIVRK